MKQSSAKWIIATFLMVSSVAGAATSPAYDLKVSRNEARESLNGLLDELASRGGRAEADSLAHATKLIRSYRTLGEGEKDATQMSIADSPYLTLVLAQKLGDIYPALFAQQFFEQRAKFLGNIPVELLFDGFMDQIISGRLEGSLKKTGDEIGACVARKIKSAADDQACPLDTARGGKVPGKLKLLWAKMTCKQHWVSPCQTRQLFFAAAKEQLYQARDTDEIHQLVKREFFEAFPEKLYEGFLPGIADQKRGFPKLVASKFNGELDPFWEANTPLIDGEKGSNGKISMREFAGGLRADINLASQLAGSNDSRDRGLAAALFYAAANRLLVLTGQSEARWDGTKFLTVPSPTGPAIAPTGSGILWMAQGPSGGLVPVSSPSGAKGFVALSCEPAPSGPHAPKIPNGVTQVNGVPGVTGIAAISGCPTLERLPMMWRPPVAATGDFGGFGMSQGPTGTTFSAWDWGGYDPTTTPDKGGTPFRLFPSEFVMGPRGVSALPPNDDPYETLSDMADILTATRDFLAATSPNGPFARYFGDASHVEDLLDPAKPMIFPREGRMLAVGLLAGVLKNLVAPGHGHLELTDPGTVSGGLGLAFHDTVTFAGRDDGTGSVRGVAKILIAAADMRATLLSDSDIPDQLKAYVPQLDQALQVGVLALSAKGQHSDGGFYERLGNPLTSGRSLTTAIAAMRAMTRAYDMSHIPLLRLSIRMGWDFIDRFWGPAAFPRSIEGSNSPMYPSELWHVLRLWSETQRSVRGDLASDVDWSKWDSRMTMLRQKLLEQLASDVGPEPL